MKKTEKAHFILAMAQFSQAPSRETKDMETDPFLIQETNYAIHKTTNMTS